MKGSYYLAISAITFLLVIGGLYFWSNSVNSPVFLFKVRCSAKGGEIEKIPANGITAEYYACMSKEKFADAKKSCEKDSDCLGRCIPMLSPTDTPIYPGRCSEREMFYNLNK